MGRSRPWGRGQGTGYADSYQDPNTIVLSDHRHMTGSTYPSLNVQRSETQQGRARPQQDLFEEQDPSTREGSYGSRRDRSRSPGKPSHEYRQRSRDGRHVGTRAPHDVRGPEGQHGGSSQRPPSLGTQSADNFQHQQSTLGRERGRPRSSRFARDRSVQDDQRPQALGGSGSYPQGTVFGNQPLPSQPMGMPQNTPNISLLDRVQALSVDLEQTRNLMQTMSQEDLETLARSLNCFSAPVFDELSKRKFSNSEWKTGHIVPTWARPGELVWAPVFDPQYGNVPPHSLERSNSAYGRICNKNRLCLIINVEDEEATVLVATSFSNRGKPPNHLKGSCIRLIRDSDQGHIPKDYTLPVVKFNGAIPLDKATFLRYIRPRYFSLRATNLKWGGTVLGAEWDKVQRIIGLGAARPISLRADFPQAFEGYQPNRRESGVFQGAENVPDKLTVKNATLPPRASDTDFDAGNGEKSSVEGKTGGSSDGESEVKKSAADEFEP